MAAREKNKDEAKMMCKGDLIAKVAEDCDRPKAEVKRMLDAALAEIGDALRDGVEVRIADFGVFEACERKSHKGRNPQTGEEMTIPACVAVRFRALKALKDKANPGKGK